MKKTTNKTAETLTGQSAVYFHEILLFAGAAIMLAVAYPRPGIVPDTALTLNMASAVPASAVMEPTTMSPAELTDTARLTDMEQISVVPADPKLLEVLPDPAS